MRGRRWARLPVLAALLVSAGLGGSLTACSHTVALSPSSAAVPSASPTTLPIADAERLSTALTSADPTVVSGALAPAVAAAYTKAPRALLPSGSTVEVLTDRMLVSGDSATVPAKVTGGSEAGTYLLVLVRQDGQWLLVGTEKQ